MLDTNAIVLDKSFLQGAKAIRVRELALSNRLVVSDALFYELLTCGEPVRSQCFAKFPPGERQVDLVSHIGALIRLEMDSHSRSGKPSIHREELRFQFNPSLVSSDYELPGEALAAIEVRTQELREDVQGFLERAEMIPSFFPDILEGSDAQRRAAHSDAERAIAEPGALIPFYSQLEPPEPKTLFPPADIVSDDWAVYRWLQVQLLFALDVYVRYRGTWPKELTGNTYEKMEHDVLDAQVLMLGCLEGAFATREVKLRRWWSLLCPSGSLYG